MSHHLLSAHDIFVDPRDICSDIDRLITITSRKKKVTRENVGLSPPSPDLANVSQVSGSREEDCILGEGGPWNRPFLRGLQRGKDGDRAALGTPR